MASAKVLRSIQQIDLPLMESKRKVLGVIRPGVEKVAKITRNGRIGVLGTSGTVASVSFGFNQQPGQITNKSA